MEVTQVRANYIEGCPNCGGEITDEELLLRIVCSKCISEPANTQYELYERLKNSERLLNFKEPLELAIWINDFKDFFKRLVGARPWSLQETWTRRVYLGRSFSIVAPTGMGKSIFGLVMCIFLATRGQKCYFIVPSSLLVQHFLEEANAFIEKISGVKPKVIGFYSGMSKREAEEILKRIGEKDFYILITTDRFLYNRFDILMRNDFNFIFVDDVDPFLKSPKNIDKVIMLMRFKPDVIDEVIRIIELRRKRRLTEEELGELDLLEESINNHRGSVKKVLVVSGATLRGVRSRRLQLFRYLFGFQPGYSFEFVRNITNFIVKKSTIIEEEVYNIVKKFGGGCLIFVPQTEGISYASRLAEYLNKKQIPVHAYSKMDPKMIHLFINGNFHALIGVVSNKSPLVRGIDLPENNQVRDIRRSA